MGRCFSAELAHTSRRLHNIYCTFFVFILDIRKLYLELGVCCAEFFDCCVENDTCRFVSFVEALFSEDSLSGVNNLRTLRLRDSSSQQADWDFP